MNCFQENLVIDLFKPSSIEDVLSIFPTSPYPMVLTSSESPHAILNVNQAWEDCFGYNVEEIRDRTFRFLQGPETDQDELEKISYALIHEQAVQVQLTNYTKYDQIVRHQLTIIPLISSSRSSLSSSPMLIDDSPSCEEKQPRKVRYFLGISKIGNQM